jgi:uncharacterized membrane-anchored protein YhcB (DUF1043 family)
MAYVRRTQTLIESVEHKVEIMRDAELRALSKTKEHVDIGTPLHIEMVKTVEDTLWQEAPDLKSKVPDSWVRKESSISVSFRREGSMDAIRETIESSSDDKIKLPPSHGRWDTVEVTEKFMQPLVKGWVDRRKKVERKQQEVHDTFENIRKQLVSFLGTHASLNTAVKDMPELELYLADEYLKRLAEKVVRSKPNATPKVEELGIDLDAITRAAVAHRITSAGE